ncbi:hypothetical protein BGZ73_005935 [Actinomortierella ambigua]|nr:hypothetical protein BGZ73_005935 [Actinomortierella ambigua]
MPKALVLRQGSMGCTSRYTRQLHSGQRDYPVGQPTFLPIPPSRPILLPFLHPLRRQTAPLPSSRRASSTLTAAAPATAATQLESIEHEIPPSSCPQPSLDTSCSLQTSCSYAATPEISPASTTTTSTTKRGRGRPRKETSSVAKMSSKATLKRKSLTYQECSVEGMGNSMYGLEPAPFPKSVLTSLTTTPTLHARMSRSSQFDNEELNDTGRSNRNIPTSSLHNDLKSFTSIDHNNTNSTLYRGTLFEYQTQKILRDQLGIYTHRSAGLGDEGVDLRGKWFLPISASPSPDEWVRHLNVIVQCKKMTGKIGPRYVRELQGTLSYESQPTLAILAIASDFTKHALVPCLKSLWPMALIVIDIERQECRKLLWNQAAERVMHGVQIGVLRQKNEVGGAKDPVTHAPAGMMEGRPVLCFKGSVLERLPGPLKSPKRDNDVTTNSHEDRLLDDKSFARKEEKTTNALTPLSDHSSPTINYFDTTYDLEEEFLINHSAEYDKEEAYGVDDMGEEYAEYIRALKKIDQLLIEADSQHEFSNEDWAWIDQTDKTLEWVSIEPRSSEAGDVQILHPIDLSTLVQPSTQSIT